MKTLCVDRTYSAGFAIARAYVVQDSSISADKNYIDDIDGHLFRFQAAVDKAIEALTLLSKTDDVFFAHLEIAQDPTLIKGVQSKIQKEYKNAEWALEETVRSFADLFLQMDDEYLRARGSDVLDVGHRIMMNLKGIDDKPLSGMSERAVIAARDLTPSDTVHMDRYLVEGILTEESSVTSHVSIMAKNLGIPALVAVKGLLENVHNGDLVIIDAQAGILIIDPDEDTEKEYIEKKEAWEKRTQKLNKLASLPSVTSDGKEIRLYANVGSITDIEQAVACHADGVGLFRTELLYMEQQDFPSEDMQYEIYKHAAELLGGKELIIRTLDIGGDKGLPYFDFGKEDNPFLGYRAIRLCLDRPDIFKTQLRAILRASCHGNVSIMYPMIISINELDTANALLETCKKELDTEGVQYNANVSIGMMIETPAAVILSERFAKKADFFSIGTNDLTQYMLAVDRGNNRISHMYQPLHPAVLQAISHVIQAGHKYNIPVGICGELAGDVNACEVLIGLGFDELSMSPSAIAEIKQVLRDTDAGKAKHLAEIALADDTISNIKINKR